jgi:MFS family permease
MGLFSFAESPQLQALLADVVPTRLRDVTFALYFTMAFGVGSLWAALYGLVIDGLGEAAGLPIVFVLMASSFLAAAIVMWPVRDDAAVGRDVASIAWVSSIVACGWLFSLRGGQHEAGRPGR